MAQIGGGVLLLAIFVAAVLPNRYESTATLLIEPQTISDRLVESNLTQSDLNNRLHLISMQILSRGRLSRVIDDLRLYPELADELTREEVIERMRDEIAIAPVLSELDAQAGNRNRDVQINTFELTFRHRDSKTAADVTNRLATDFVNEHLSERTEVSKDTAEFIEVELERLGRRTLEVESQIARIKAENRGRLPEDLDPNQRLHERLMLNLREVQRELAIAESDEAFYRQQVLSGGNDFDKYNSAMTPQRRLEMLQLQMNEYRSRGFTDKHPDMVATTAEISELREKIRSGSAGEEGLTPSQLNARAEQQRAGLRVASARGEMERLRQQIERVEQNLGDTPRVAEQLGQYERELEHLHESFQQYSAKRLEAGVAADMESRQKGERFRVLEAAVPEPEPASPNRLLIGVLGLLLGLALAGGAGLLAESTDASFHASSRLQERLGVAVLASIPAIALASDAIAARARRMRRAAIAAALTAATLVLSVGGNWAVNGLPSALRGEDRPAAPAEPAAALADEAD
jgi:polysaccharide chain length determinant protein (PEP-CTERM system associated)